MTVTPKDPIICKKDEQLPLSCEQLEKQSEKLKWVSWLDPGRDVVLAIDLTESVGLNDSGRRTLRQIVEDSLKPGDITHIITFSDKILSRDSLKEFEISQIEEVLAKIPLKVDKDQKNTDIQEAELYIYKYLAQLNYDRLTNQRPVKSQSVIWITDAPLFTESGITSDIWIETPTSSPFRDKNSPKSVEREKWLEVLPYTEQSKQIQKTVGSSDYSNSSFTITIVDIPPFIQESCAPLTGGRMGCLVDPYINQQLFWPSIFATIGLAFFLVLLVPLIRYCVAYNKTWVLEVGFESDHKRDDKTLYLKLGEKISIGEEDLDGLPGITQTVAYLERRKNSLYIVSLGDENNAVLELDGIPVKSEQDITRKNFFRVNCHSLRGRDYLISFAVKK